MRNGSFIQALFTVYFRVCQYLTMTRLFPSSLLQEDYDGTPGQYCPGFLVKKNPQKGKGFV
ncbi:MAG: hypothetical protein D3908_02585 [Candidatus Electrothrix sp. AUS4]|nr:hypothetical protein [Candidatus Electrothrix sp. AUS4]